MIGHLSFVWALRDSDRSSHVKIADRGFASRQSASLVPIKRGKLRRFVLYNGRKLCVPPERLKVNHLFNLIDLERCAQGDRAGVAVSKLAAAGPLGLLAILRSSDYEPRTRLISTWASAIRRARSSAVCAMACDPRRHCLHQRCQRGVRQC